MNSYCEVSFKSQVTIVNFHTTLKTFFQTMPS